MEQDFRHKEYQTQTWKEYLSVLLTVFVHERDVHKTSSRNFVLCDEWVKRRGVKAETVRGDPRGEDGGRPQRRDKVEREKLDEE